MTSSDQPPPAAPPQQQHKHFMTLGGGIGIPTKKITFGQNSLSPSALSNSFSITREQQQAPISHLPDIYTTCPELRKFKTLMILTPNSSFNQNNNNININNNNDEQPQQQQQQQQQQQTEIAKCSKPAQQRSHEQQPIVPPIRRPPMIQNPSPPIMFPMQHCPFPIFPIFQIFDPNAPVLRPHELGFVPRSEWPPQVFSLWDLRQMYFTRRNGAGRRFDFKLYNALCITKVFPPAYAFIGAMWIGPTLMKIHSQTFAHLLGIHAVQGGLFHKQGNFSRHGFQQVQKQSQQAMQLNIDLRDVDDYNVRLFTDQYNRFSRDTEFVITDSLPAPIDEDEEEDAPPEK